MIAAPPSPPLTSLARAAGHPHLVDAVVGRLLELVVRSIEGARARVRSRSLVH